MTRRMKFPQTAQNNCKLKDNNLSSIDFVEIFKL